MSTESGGMPDANWASPTGSNTSITSNTSGGSPQNLSGSQKLRRRPKPVESPENSAPMRCASRDNAVGSSPVDESTHSRRAEERPPTSIGVVGGAVVGATGCGCGLRLAGG